MTDEEYPDVKRVLESKTLYEVLNIEEKSTTEEIKRSYKKLAMKVHPDRCKHPQATPAFQRISHAYQVLSDEQKRAQYDKYGENAPEPTNFQGARQNFYYSPGGYYTFDDQFSAEDLFNMFFNNMYQDGFVYETYTFGPNGFARRQRQQRQRQQQQYEYEANLPFYKRPTFYRTLLYLIPMILLVLNLFMSQNDDDRINWEEQIVFDVENSKEYITMKSFKHKVRFGLSRSWLSMITRKHGRLTTDFYRLAREKADEVFEKELKQKCREERINNQFEQPSCEKMAFYHIR